MATKMKRQRRHDKPEGTFLVTVPGANGFGHDVVERDYADLLPAGPIRLDLGCGPNKRPGFRGVDATAFPGVDVVHDLRTAPWPWTDGSVEEVHTSHFVEHLTAMERATFANELYRVLTPTGKCTLIVPHWSSCRAYGDPTHQWPPVSEMWFYYLDRDWRAANAPHTDAKYLPGGFACHLAVTWAYQFNPALNTKNQQAQQYAIENYKDAIHDVVATLTRKP